MSWKPKSLRTKQTRLKTTYTLRPEIIDGQEVMVKVYTTTEVKVHSKVSMRGRNKTSSSKKGKCK